MHEYSEYFQNTLRNTYISCIHVKFLYNEQLIAEMILIFFVNIYIFLLNYFEKIIHFLKFIHSFLEFFEFSKIFLIYR